MTTPKDGKFWCDEKGCFNEAQTGDPTERNLLMFKCVGCAEAARERGETGQRRPDPQPDFKSESDASIESEPPPAPPPPMPAAVPSPARHLGIVVTPVRAKPAPPDTRSVYERLLNGNAGRTWLNLKTAAKELGLEDPAILAGAIRRGELLRHRYYSHEPFPQEAACDENSRKPAPTAALPIASGGTPSPAPMPKTDTGDGAGAAGGNPAPVSPDPKPAPSTRPAAPSTPSMHPDPETVTPATSPASSPPPSPRKKGTPMPVRRAVVVTTAKGEKEYPTVSAAADACGVSAFVLKRHMDDGEEVNGARARFADAPAPPPNLLPKPTRPRGPGRSSRRRCPS